jgi:hypothetical protein
MLATALTLFAVLPGLPAGAAVANTANLTYHDGAYYCFGKRATIVGTNAKGYNRPDWKGNWHFYRQINGTAGDDVIVGTTGPDAINSLGGNDLICSGGGPDEVFVDLRGGSAKVDAGAGDDEVWPGWYDRSLRCQVQICTNAGDEQRMKWDGSIEIHGGPGDDALYGGDANDVMYGDTGNNRADCHGGWDAFRYPQNSGNWQHDCEMLGFSTTPYQTGATPPAYK